MDIVNLANNMHIFDSRYNCKLVAIQYLSTFIKHHIKILETFQEFSCY